MNPLIECVPNFSEGRDPAIVQALLAAVRSVAGVWVLDHSMDPDHHRAVVTFIGAPQAVGEAALRAMRVATSLIDLRSHEGVHPRVGATDVVPFVPIQGTTMEDCVQLAHHIGRHVAEELRIPVFLYERAARLPHRTRLESIRQGGLSGLRHRMETDLDWEPDYGPARPHDTAGAVVIGARPVLIAFNANLNSTALPTAQSIAKTIRESAGGLPCLKAIGVELKSRRMVQVAMNLTDYCVTSLNAAFQAVEREAARHGVEIAGTEFVGLVPQAALDRVAAASLRCDAFDPTQILEHRLRAVTSAAEGQSMPEFLNEVAAPKPTPAGGSASALVGALAASLGVMGARLTARAQDEAELLKASERLYGLIQGDMEAYEGVAVAGNIPKSDPERTHRLETARHQATEIPLEIAEVACAAGRVILGCRVLARPPLQSDLTVGLILAIAAADSGLHTAKVNTKSLKTLVTRQRFEARIEKISRSLEELRSLCYTPPS
jgi:glutamate formiminotransferase/glutamate formiminotransferase/formiminotetrahydrofolate cyclodeaminase